MEIRTSALTGPALNWAVAKAQGAKVETHGSPSELFIEWPDNFMFLSFFKPSINWPQGGPIIEWELISVEFVEDEEIGSWIAYQMWDGSTFDGPTPLIAAMRCYVASKLGDAVDVPEELL